MHTLKVPCEPNFPLRHTVGEKKRSRKPVGATEAPGRGHFIRLGRPVTTGANLQVRHGSLEGLRVASHVDRLRAQRRLWTDS